MGEMEEFEEKVLNEIGDTNRHQGSKDRGGRENEYSDRTRARRERASRPVKDYTPDGEIKDSDYVGIDEEIESDLTSFDSDESVDAESSESSDALIISSSDEDRSFYS